MPYDGECAPAAIAHQLVTLHFASAPLSGSDVRKQCVEHIQNDYKIKATVAERLSEQTIDDYVQEMAMRSTWADDNFLYAASVLYDVDIIIIRDDGSAPVCIGSAISSRSIKLGYVSCADGEMQTHYVSLVEKTNEASAMKQVGESGVIV